MIVVLVLLGALLACRAIGALGVQYLDSWIASTRSGLALMFLFTASAHFTTMKEDLVRMVPPAFPCPRQIVFISGILEILGAIGLLPPSTRPWAGLGLVLLMIAMFPANVYAARRGLTLRGKSATPLALRLPMQILFITLTWWSSSACRLASALEPLCITG
ncbi:MAG TPA: DoxX family protein [Terriglobales bacterium]|nr:DoxX family protein [Terriglobales bacterium]